MNERGFRALLILGAVVSIGIGVSGLVFTGALETILGVDLPNRARGTLGIVRLYGGTMIAIGVGYALAAAHPARNRSLLVPLFIVPVLTATSTIAALARDEVATGRGVVFTAYNLAYALLFFRMYPRIEGAPRTEDGPAPSEPPAPPASPEGP